MNQTSQRILSIAILLLFALPLSAAEIVKGRHVEVSLVAPVEFGADKTTIGIKYAIDPDWHIYWKNPGDSGAAPKFRFTSLTSDIGPAFWPAPKRLPVGELVNLGYDGVVTLPFEITPKSGADKVTFEAKLEWLVCDIGECIPGFGTLHIERPISAVEKWNDHDLGELRRQQSRVPQKSADSPWRITELKREGEQLTINVAGSGNADHIDLFPTDGLAVRPQAPLKTKRSNQVVFAFRLQAGLGALAATGFVLTDGEKSWEWKDLKLETAKFVPASIGLISLLVLLLSSFVGGIILNFMPCVLPVLSIKFLSISRTPPAHRVKEALLYTAGVLLTFTLLGGAFLALRSAGSSVGWGFQLQSPLVVLALIVLFWLMALNFLGVFEFGTSIMNAAGKSGRGGAFATGVLSVFVAAPCTGPFMGTALGAAATLPAIESLAIFIFLGLGLASPFLLVAVSPRARRLIPRPGAWMEKLKEFFAFPLIATVIWLLWVLHLQVGVDALPSSLGVLFLVSFSLWWGKNLKWSFLPWLAAAVMLGATAVDFNKKAGASISHESGLWEAFSPAKVEAARVAGKPVFIDFTAAWCITCQFNKKAVLSTTAVEALMKEKGVALFEADWTKQDPVITEALAALGRNSVPVYAFYPRGSNEAVLLPQILTSSMIEDLMKEKVP